MINKFANRLLGLPRPAKRAIALALDSALCVFCVWFALGVRSQQWGFDPQVHGRAAFAAIGLALPIFIVSGFYRAIFRFSGNGALMALVKACSTFSLLYFFLFSVVSLPEIPRSIGLSVPLLIFVTVGASRMLIRYWLDGTYQHLVHRGALPQVVIYGAGAAGRQLAAALENSREMVVRAFVDDSGQLQGRTLN
jgi:FlaA1/EpsC-like NDP-sugar epimerase